jgi:carbamate kinase
LKLECHRFPTPHHESLQEILALVPQTPIVVTLGGNALFRRGEPMTAEAQRLNIAIAAQALAAEFTRAMVITHGNGPQVGLLVALRGYCRP